jgi:hypothetical protein
MISDNDDDENEAVNETVRALLEQIILPIHKQHGTGEDVMVLVESVCAGVVLALARIYPHLKGSEVALAGALADRIGIRVAMALAQNGEGE